MCTISIIYLPSVYFCILFACMYYVNSNLIMQNVLCRWHRKRKEGALGKFREESVPVNEPTDFNMSLF